MAVVQNEILNCPNYFLSWLRECNVHLDNTLISTITEELYKGIGYPIDSDHNDESDSESVVFLKNVPKLANCHSDDKHGFTKEKILIEHGESMVKLQKAMGPLVEAFLNIQIGNMKLAIKNIDWVQKQMDNHFTQVYGLNDYIAGYTFLIEMLLIHMTVLNGVSQKHLLQATLRMFETVTSQEKSVVMLGRWMLVDSIIRAKNYPEELSHLYFSEMSNFDPTNWVWHYFLCSRMRYFQRSISVKRLPYKKVKAALEWYPLFSNINRHSDVCRHLAEEIKSHHWSGSTYPDILIGELTFPNAEAAVAYIKSHATELFGRKTVKILKRLHYDEFNSYAAIFSSILPPRLRDYELAKVCVQFALLLEPSGINANYRMGLIQLTGFQDVEKAAMFMEMSMFEKDRSFCHFYALLDLIKTLLSSVTKYDKRLKNAFSLAHKHKPKPTSKNFIPKDKYVKPLSEKQYSDLEFFEGCYLFLKNEVKKAVICWTRLVPGSYDFACFQPTAKRYLWSNETIKGLSKENILRGIKSATDQENCKIKNLILRIEREMPVISCEPHFLKSNSEYKQRSTLNTRRYLSHEKNANNTPNQTTKGSNKAPVIPEARKSQHRFDYLRNWSPSP